MRPTVLIILVGAAVGCAGCSPRDEAAAPEPVATSTPAVTPVDDVLVTTQIEARYFTTPEVKAGTIDVSTSGGVVTLTGEVKSDAAKQQALAVARQVEGVRDVRDQLTVATPTAATSGTAASPEPRPGETSGKAAAAKPGEPAGAAWTTTKIQARYFADPDVKGRNIDVTTRDGVVTLSGRVETEAQRVKAVQIARGTDGVRAVQDSLTVGAAADAVGSGGPATRPTDEQLVPRVQAKFYQNDNLRGSSIDVASSQRVVTLSGAVQSEARKRLAVSIARSVDGVSEVRDELRVDPTVPPLPAERDSSNVKRATVRSDLADAWITAQIQARYYLDPDIKGHNVDVTTKGGVVTLAGTVSNDPARQQALAIARDTDDVVRVVDKLTLASPGPPR